MDGVVALPLSYRPLGPGEIRTPDKLDPNEVTPFPGYRLGLKNFPKKTKAGASKREGVEPISPKGIFTSRSTPLFSLSEEVCAINASSGGKSCGNVKGQPNSRWSAVVACILVNPIKPAMKYFLLLLTGLGLLACEKEEALPFIEFEEREEARITAIVAEINTLTSPIISPLPNQATTDLQAFDYLAEARIVGMGEATHGTKDFFQMKDRLFRYLVEEHGFKAIIFEMDFAEALIFDDYVRNGEGSLDELMRKHMFFWIWTTREVKSLLQWMRSYNSGRPASEQLRFLGNDSQTTRYNAAALLRSVKRLHPELATAIELRTSAYRQLDRNTYAAAGAELHHQILTDLKAVQTLLRATEPELTAASSVEEYTLLLRLSQTLIDTEALLYAEHQATYVNLRDARMADNSRWWTEQLGPTAKTALWAHNLHVADLPDLQNGASMGHHLKAYYGKAYQNLGFSFSTGAFLARAPTLASPPNIRQITAAPPTNSFHHYFSRTAEDNFLLRTADIPLGSATDQLFRQPLLFYTIGSSLIGETNRGLQPTPITPYFDAIIHFERTEAAEGMW